jgi:Ca-activated chloride channel family protein
LRAEDFIIYDNDIAQKVTYFSYDLLPLAVAVLIDRSASVSPYMPMLQLAALLSLRHLKPEDKVALFSFDSRSKKVNDLTQDRLLIAKKINEIGGGGGTNIYDAIYDAARYLRDKAPNRRRAIILVSDNCHTTGNMKLKAERARTEILETAATLHSIRVPISFSGLADPGNPGEMDDVCPDSNGIVRRMAMEAGGELLEVGSSSSLQKSLETAILNLRYQYTLGFNPSNPGEEGSFHRLTVKLATPDRCPECQLLVRSGYYSGISMPAPRPKSVQPAQPDSEKNTDEVLIQRSILTAGTFSPDLLDIGFSVKTTKQMDSNGKLQLKVDLHIDSDDVGFKRVKDQHACNLHVAVFYADKNGEILGSDWKKYAGLLSEEIRNRIMKEGLLLSTTIPAVDKMRLLKVIVYDEENNKIGSRLIELAK